MGKKRLVLGISILSLKAAALQSKQQLQHKSCLRETPNSS